MAYRTKESVSRHVQLALEKLEADKELPFRQLLDEKRLQAALERGGVIFRERIYTPLVTLCAFLSQVVSGENSSCKDAVSRVLADRAAQRLKPCSPDTASYCEARGRLPEQVLSDLTRQTGRELHQQAEEGWLWKGRRVTLVDGSTATMDDTDANQDEYPQSRNQKAGLGFPILRFVVFLSLSVGAVLECAMGKCRGKQTGEQSLFRQICETLPPGEIVLGDRLYDCYRDICVLRARGVDSVFGKKQLRHCDFRKGRRLGPSDHVVMWKKPKYDSSRYASKAEWESLPEQMEMREVRVTVRRAGHKTKTIAVVTTLLDAEQYSAEDLANLFAERWHCELDLRSIKRALGMHHLHCRTPEMVRKELWAHLLAYNLIRVRMAQAAALHGQPPRRLSFTAAQTLIHSFAPHLNTTRGEKRRNIEVDLLLAISRSTVPERPGRTEPRAVKKRETKYSHLTKPRAQARKQLAT